MDMKLKEALEYLAKEAWMFHAGASPQVSRFAYLLEELVAREYEKITGKEYPQEGRLYDRLGDQEVREMLEEQLLLYQEMHPGTVEITRLVMKHFYGEGDAS